jgi:hypothetical protein
MTPYILSSIGQKVKGAGAEKTGLALEGDEKQWPSPPAPSPNPSTNSGWERGNRGQRKEGMGSQRELGKLVSSVSMQDSAKGVEQDAHV